MTTIVGITYDPVIAKLNSFPANQKQVPGTVP
jgi:hypothetical protein